MRCLKQIPLMNIFSKSKIFTPCLIYNLVWSRDVLWLSHDRLIAFWREKVHTKVILKMPKSKRIGYYVLHWHNECFIWNRVNFTGNHGNISNPNRINLPSPRPKWRVIFPFFHSYFRHSERDECRFILLGRIISKIKKDPSWNIQWLAWKIWAISSVRRLQLMFVVHHGSLEVHGGTQYATVIWSQ